MEEYIKEVIKTATFLKEGGVDAINLEQLYFLLKFQNYFNINTISVQQSGDMFFVKADDLTIERYKKESQI